MLQKADLYGPSYATSWFLDLQIEFSMLEFFQPNPVQAPWHVQCKVGGYLINIYPHKGTVYLEGHPAGRFREGFAHLVQEALNDPL